MVVMHDGRAGYIDESSRESELAGAKFYELLDDAATEQTASTNHEHRSYIRIGLDAVVRQRELVMDQSDELQKVLNE